MQNTYDVIILGAGTAGLTAMKEVRRHTESFLLIDPGPLGTTCARVGCMPSKALIQLAYDVQRSRLLQKEGVLPEDSRVNVNQVFTRMRQFRDHFVEPLVRETESLAEHFLQGRARFTGPHSLIVDGRQPLEAKSIIIATGSRPFVPDSWPQQHPRIRTTDDFFELSQLPQKWAVVGLGPIGLELGQALAHLGLDVYGFDRNKTIGGLAGSQLNELACEILGRDMTMSLGQDVEVKEQAGQLEITSGVQTVRVDAVLVAMGRRPNVEDLDLEKTGCEFTKGGWPVIDEATLSLVGLPIFLAGDVDKKKPILHEAADDGRIAGYNACHAEPLPNKRRTPITVVFTHPGIATVGSREMEGKRVTIGRVSYEDQGRAKIMRENQGAVHLHVTESDGRLIGADLLAPEAEHLAQLLAWSVQRRLTVHELLELPFYHPTLEEGLRTALRDAARQLEMARVCAAER